MITSIAQLIENISNDNLREHLFTNVELKRTWEQKFGQKISGLGNRISTSSSWVIIGIENDGTLVGNNETWAKKTEEIISQHLNEYLDPIQTCIRIKPVAVKNNWMIIIELKNPGAVTYWDKKAFKASGTTIAEMQPNEIMDLTIKLPGMNDFSRQYWKGEISNSLAKSFCESLVKNRKELSEIYTEEKDIQKLFASIHIKNTHSLRLLFGETRFRIVFYNSSEEPVSNEIRTGLYSLLSDSLISEVQAWPAKINNNCQEEPFPQKALKEALSNAVAHSAYFENDGEIILEVFTNRVEISNICLPESCYFANKWFSRSHKTVNALLMETLRLAGHVDELGRGKYLIFSESIKLGKQPPNVSVERSGRFNRWRLCVFGDESALQKKLLKRIREVYPNPQKAHIAHALVLWRSLSVSTIRTYIDGDSAHLFAEVLSDPNGPIFYYQKEDQIVLRRWVKILLEEGKDSKAFSPEEDDNLFQLSYDIQTKYHRGIITTAELRKLAHMGDTKSETVLSSSILKKWEKLKRVEKIRKGVYKFMPPSIPYYKFEVADLTKILFSDYDKVIDFSSQNWLTIPNNPQSQISTDGYYKKKD